MKTSKHLRKAIQRLWLDRRLKGKLAALTLTTTTLVGAGSIPGAKAADNQDKLTMEPLTTDDLTMEPLTTDDLTMEPLTTDDLTTDMPKDDLTSKL